MTAWFAKKNSHPEPSIARPDAELIADKLKKFIASKSKLVDSSEIANDTPLFSSGILDSLAFIELVLHVEKEFSLKLADVIDVNMNSLDSIGQIIGAVQKHSNNA